MTRATVLQSMIREMVALEGRSVRHLSGGLVLTWYSDERALYAGRLGVAPSPVELGVLSDALMYVMGVDGMVEVGVVYEQDGWLVSRMVWVAQGVLFSSDRNYIKRDLVYDV